MSGYLTSVMKVLVGLRVSDIVSVFYDENVKRIKEKTLHLQLQETSILSRRLYPKVRKTMMKYLENRKETVE